jgi:hypothetical protein
VPKISNRLLAAALLVAAGPASAQTITFGEAQTGQLPSDFVSARTGSGALGRWEVVQNASTKTGHVLAQLSADKTDYRFPLAIYTPTVIGDLEASVRFMAISGTVDQAGGVAVRISDADNYYLARVNALENNVGFYRVKAGRREELAGADVKVTAGEWHTLTLLAQGTRFTVSFDGEVLMRTQDPTFTTGKVGFWTKADSVSHFERLEIVAFGCRGTGMITGSPHSSEDQHLNRMPKWFFLIWGARCDDCAQRRAYAAFLSARCRPLLAVP